MFLILAAAHLTTIHYRRDRHILGPVATKGSTSFHPRFAIKKVTTSGPSSTSWYCELQYFPVEEEEGEEGVNKNAEPKSIFSNTIKI